MTFHSGQGLSAWGSVFPQPPWQSVGRAQRLPEVSALARGDRAGWGEGKRPKEAGLHSAGWGRRLGPGRVAGYLEGGLRESPGLAKAHSSGVQAPSTCPPTLHPTNRSKSPAGHGPAQGGQFYFYIRCEHAEGQQEADKETESKGDAEVGTNG